MATDAYVRARIDTETKNRAGIILESMGLNISDAIRMMLIQVIREGRLPFEIKQPNQATADAIDELESGQGKRFDTTDQLFNDLGL